MEHNSLLNLEDNRVHVLYVVEVAEDEGRLWVEAAGDDVLGVLERQPVALCVPNSAETDGTRDRKREWQTKKTTVLSIVENLIPFITETLPVPDTTTVEGDVLIYCSSGLTFKRRYYG